MGEGCCWVWIGNTLVLVIFRCKSQNFLNAVFLLNANVLSLFFSPFSWILNQVWRGFYSLVVVLCWRKTTCTIAAKTKHKLGRSESLIQNHIKRKRRHLLKKRCRNVEPRCNIKETLALFYTIIDMQEWAAQGKRGARGLGSAVVETQNFFRLCKFWRFLFFNNDF